MKLVVVLVSLFVAVIGQEEFYDKTIEELGFTERLYCGNFTPNQVYPNDSIPTAWMMPGLSVLNASSNKYLMEDGLWTLAIVNVTRDDLGVYHCMMTTPSNEWFLIRLGLNAAGPYFAPLWDTYELNTIIGLSAAGIFMLIVLLIYITSKIAPPYDCQGEEDSPDTITPREVEEKIVNGNGVGLDVQKTNPPTGEVNRAFNSYEAVNEDIVVGSSTKYRVNHVTDDHDEDSESITTDL